jgi:hypothetical protein
VEDAEIDEQVRNKLSGIFAETDRVVADRFLVAQDKGQLFQQSDPQTLARMIISITPANYRILQISVTAFIVALSIC